jgi:hypothetical protein
MPQPLNAVEVNASLAEGGCTLINFRSSIPVILNNGGTGRQYQNHPGSLWGLFLFIFPANAHYCSPRNYDSPGRAG